jgi:tRNA pseudouridine38-40 synthase
MRYRARIEYDGTEYFGFQRQRPSQPTIQSELEQALGGLAREPIGVTGAGRTDAGVHATGQIISFDLEWNHGAPALVRALNSGLPDAIVVHEIEEASLDFHPRFDARSRAYEYYVYNSKTRSPIRRLRSWHVRSQLDVDAMSEAAGYLVGQHDFATFGRPPQGDNSVREVMAANWCERDGLLVFFIEANAFLYRMVRSIVGSLIAVGDGRWSVEAFANAHRAAERRQARAAAPPHGLYLVRVTY